MTPDRWRQVTAIFHAVRAGAPDRRQTLLDELCGGDATLRAEVESLLTSDGDAIEPVSITNSIRSMSQLTAGTSFGQYRIDGLVGSGGMGQVYRATDTRLHRSVAIKILTPGLADDPDHAARLEREARLLASLSHPNIAAIYGLEEANHVKGLVLEFVEGPTLADRLARGRTSIPESLTIAKQIALALEAAHEKGIVHRDLKPANVKVTPAGLVKVLDFGIAKAVDPGGASIGLRAADATGTGLILGTPAYMSPEQARGQALDKRADIWAFGCVLFEMLTGRGAFAGGTASDSLAKVIEREPDWSALPAGVPPAVRRLLAHCLQKDPAERLHDIADARIEIADSLAAPPGTGESAAVPAPRRLLQGWRAHLAAGAALAVVIIAVVAFWPARIVAPVSAVSVVALPAQVLGAQELGFLTDAIPSTLSTQLGQVEGLEIKVPPTSLEFETIQRNLGRIADLYGVSRCIVSSITATDADHFVLNVTLVEPRSGKIVWGQRYEGPRGSYLELARQAADGIRQNLRVVGSLTGTGQTANSEAELALREGTYFMNRYNNAHQQTHFDLASTAFERALSLDPRLADAAGHLAMLHRFKWEAGAPLEQQIPTIEKWANHALAITPRCSRAWSALFWADVMRPSADYRKGLEYGLKAVSTGPQDALAHTTLGGAVAAVSSELAVQAYGESRLLDPLYAYGYFNTAIALRRLGRAAEGLPIVEEGLKIEPEVPHGLRIRWSSLIALGRRSDVLAMMTERPAFFADPLARYVGAVERKESAKVDAAMREAVAAVVSPQTPTNARRVLNTTLVPYLISHGQRDAAMQVLTRMSELGDLPIYDWLRLEPQIATLRSDARFAAIEARSRARFDEVRQILDEARSRGELPAYLMQPLADLVRKLSS